jgi:hypothetical protein
MQATRLFLLQTHAQDAAILDPLTAFLKDHATSVSRVMVSPDALDGTDQAALDTLAQIRASTTAPTQSDACVPAILIAVGLSASFALWMDMLDRVRPKKTRIRHSTVIHPEVIEQPSVLSGVIALAPFLGFDFSLSSAGFGPDRFAQWRLARCRGALASLFGRGAVAAPQDHGCWSDQARVRWADLARRLPFASVAQTLPSLKRPTVLVLDARARADQVEVQLCTLSGKVAVMDSPMAMPQVGHVTLAAVDWIHKGLGST